MKARRALMKQSLLVVALLALAAPVVYAHTELAASVPSDKAALEAAPKEIVLDFSEAVRLTALSIQKSGAQKQELGPLPAETSRHFAVNAPPLGPGEYVIAWRALSEDTHVMSGEISFALQ
jgi:methionine-rich copper-binding protein CopC